MMYAILFEDQSLVPYNTESTAKQQFTAIQAVYAKGIGKKPINVVKFNKPPPPTVYKWRVKLRHRDTTGGCSVFEDHDEALEFMEHIKRHVPRTTEVTLEKIKESH